jgi:hypothetical protein
MNIINSSWLEGEGPAGSVGRMGRMGPMGRMGRGARARPRCTKPSAARDGLFAYYDGHHGGRSEADPVCPALSGIAPGYSFFGDWMKMRVGSRRGADPDRGWHAPRSFWTTTLARRRSEAMAWRFAKENGASAKRKTWRVWSVLRAVVAAGRFQEGRTEETEREGSAYDALLQRPLFADHAGQFWSRVT